MWRDDARSPPLQAVEVVAQKDREMPLVVTLLGEHVQKARHFLYIHFFEVKLKVLESPLLQKSAWLLHTSPPRSSEGTQLHQFESLWK